MLATSTLSPPKIHALQYVRAIAAFCVVLFHVYLWETKNLGDSAISSSWMRIGDVGVDLFFVISGFVMVHIQPNRLDSWSSYFRFAALRASRVYTPYWIVTFALIPVWWFAPYLFNNYYGNEVDLWRSLFLLPQDYTPLLTCAWTLSHEVYFYLAVSMVFVFPKRVLLGSLWFFGVFLMAIVYGETHFGEHRILQTVFSPFSLTFLLGYFLGVNYKRIQQLPAWCLGLSLFAGCGALIWANHLDPLFTPYPYNNDLLRFLSYGLPSAFIVLGAVGLDQKIKTPQRWLSYLGEISYATYLVHLPLIAGVYAISKRFLLDHPSWGWPTAIGVVACTYLASVLFHEWIEAPVIRCCRRRIDQWLPRQEKI